MAEPVLLTGATGFVGRALLDALVQAGIPVHAVARRPGPPRHGVTWHACDLLDPAYTTALLAAQSAPVLIHAAWYVEHGLFWASDQNALWQAASLHLARGFLAGGGRVILGLGTCAEYAALPDTAAPWPETRALDPATPYGRAKAALHADLAPLCAEAGAALIWARLFHLTGAGEDRRRFIPSLREALQADQPATVRAPALRRDIAPTAHAARALLALLQARAEGAFNIGAGLSEPLGVYATRLATALGKPHLLDLRQDAPGTDPVWMVPDLTRLHAATGLQPLTLDQVIAAALAATPPGA